jgi:hypothetical protein
MTVGENLWDYETLWRRWERTRCAEQGAYRRPTKTRRARGGEVVNALKEAFGAAGDPRFAAAIEALKEHGLDRPDAKTFQRIRWRPLEFNSIRRMEQLLRVPDRSRRIAAARTAVEFHIEAASFDAVVRRLDRAYLAHVRRTGA